MLVLQGDQRRQRLGNSVMPSKSTTLSGDHLADVWKSYSAISVQHPRLGQVHAVFDELRARYRADPFGRKEGFAILGKSFAGKTHSIEEYCRLHASSNGDNRPVVKITLGHNTSPKALLQDILKELGDGFYNKGTLSDLRDRACAFLREAGTELLLIDEFNNLTNFARDHTIWNVSEMLKTFLDRKVCHIAFVGTEDSRKIYAQNVQLTNRLVPPVIISELKLGDRAQEAYFALICTMLDHEMLARGLLDETAGLGEDELRVPLQSATCGLIGNLKNLVEEALLTAHRSGDRLLRPEYLWHAYETRYLTPAYYLPKAKIPENPFAAFASDALRVAA